MTDNRAGAMWAAQALLLLLLLLRGVATHPVTE
jgi:hypothetical protein